MPLIPIEQALQNLEEPQQGQVRIPLGGVTRPQEPERPGFFSGPLRRGGLTVGSDFTALTGLAAESLGLDETAAGMYEKAEELARARDLIPRRVGRVEDIRSASDVGVFALESLIENAPLLASIALPGGVAGKLAGAVGASARAKQIAGVTAAFMSDVGLQTGESVNIATEAGETPADVRVVGSGIGKAALDFVPILTVAKRIGLLKNIPLGRFFERDIGKELVNRGFLRRAIGEGAIIASREVPTEVAQEIINISLDRSLRQFEGQLTDDEKSQLINAAAGAAAFGLLGIPVAAVQTRTPTQQELTTAPQRQPEALPPPVPRDTPLLPAPAAFTVDTQGTVIPFGQEVDRIPIDPTIGEPITQDTVAEGIRKALEREEPSAAPDFIVTEDGVTIAQPMVPQQQAVTEILNIPEAERNIFDQALVAFEEARQEATRKDIEEIPLPSEPQRALPEPVQKLVDLRNEMLGDESLRRKTDGLLTVKGKKKVATVEKRIAALTDKLGIPNPTAAGEVNISNAEKDIADANAVEPGPKYQRLTEAEGQLLDRLEEKDIVEGLTLREEDMRERLLAKRLGEETGRVAPTVQQVKELRQLGKDIARSEGVARTDDFLREARTGDPGPLTVADVVPVVQQLAMRMPNGPRVVVANSRDANLFPTNAARRNRIQGKAKGSFFADQPDRVYIFADNHTSLEDVERTYLHEAVAHFGLRSIMDNQQLAGLLADVYRSQQQAITNRFGPIEDPQQGLRAAEEYIAELAETNSELGLLDRVIAYVKRAIRKIRPSLQYSDNDIRFLLRDVGRFLRRGIPGRNIGGLSENYAATDFLRTVGRGNVEGVIPEMDSFGKVWGAKFAGLFFTPLQIAERFNVPGAREYMEQVQLWWARKQSLTKDAADIAEAWEKMPKRDAQQLSEFIFKVMEQSYQQDGRLSDNQLTTMARQMGLTEHAMGLYKRIDAAFSDMLTKLQAGLERSAIRVSFKGDPNAVRLTEEMHALWKRDQTAFIERATGELQNIEIAARLVEIDNEMRSLRNKNYFPAMRFGQYALTVRAKQELNHNGKIFKQGEVISFEAFESLKARKERTPSLEKEFADTSKFEVTPNLISDEEFSFLGMPPSLFAALSNPDGESGLDLSPEQQAALKELFYKYSPGRAFLKHLTRRKGIAGYSTDAMRVFATYMMNAANHISRVEFNEDMNVALNSIRDAAKGRGGSDVTQVGVVRDYFMRHNHYIMNPENDLAKYRALGFLWYLGFNVKSAMVNLTQVPLVSYPFLSHHYGDKAAVGALMRGYGLVTKLRQGKAVLDPQADKHLQRAIDEGFVDESRATELAGLGESDVLQTMMPSDTNTRLINKFSYWGAWMFKHAEKFNREVVFLAARELALNTGKTQEEAFLSGRKAVQATMFEYAKWNRPTFMRGKPSVFFLFWQYIQHLAFIAGGGEGKKVAMRTWLALAVAAGLQGLPFAENIFDLIDAGGTQVNELFGKTDPRVAVREELRELANTITDRPDLIMHGMSRYYGLGPLHLLSLFGAPVPQVDVSGSISAGRPIPGTEELLSAERDPNAKFGRLMVDVLGPVVGIGYNFWRAMESNDPDTWKVWERTLPSAIASASKAIRRDARGEETFRGGGSVVEFDPNNVQQRAENIAQAFGFATTRVNQRFALRASQESLKQYWVGRRAFVLENYAYALLGQDPEAIDKARKAIKNFNREAPAAGLKIDRQSLEDSIYQRFRRAHLREVGIPAENAFVPLYKRLEQNNPEGAPDN